MIQALAEAISAVADSLGAEAPAIRVGVGPYIVAIRFSDLSLADMFAGAFAVVATGQPNFHIDVLSGADPLDLPAPIANEICFRSEGECYVVWLKRSTQILHAVDYGQRRAFCWIAEPELMAPWERSRPFLPIFQSILDPTPWLIVHAGAIARNGRAILLAGNSKSGKTSLSLAGRQEGWSFLGDDFVLLRAGDEPGVAPLYATARPRDDMWEQFQEFEGCRREVSVDLDGARHELVLRDTHRMADARSLLAATVLIDRRSRTPRLKGVSRAELLSTLLSTTNAETPGFLPQHVRKLGQILVTVRALRFDPGSHLRQAIELLANLIE